MRESLNIEEAGAAVTNTDVSIMHPTPDAHLRNQVHRKLCLREWDTAPGFSL